MTRRQERNRDGDRMIYKSEASIEATIGTVYEVVGNDTCVTNGIL